MQSHGHIRASPFMKWLLEYIPELKWLPATCACERRWIAVGVPRYLNDGWNKFDCGVVVGV